MIIFNIINFLISKLIFANLFIWTGSLSLFLFLTSFTTALTYALAIFWLLANIYTLATDIINLSELDLLFRSKLNIFGQEMKILHFIRVCVCVCRVVFYCFQLSDRLFMFNLICVCVCVNIYPVVFQSVVNKMVNYCHWNFLFRPRLARSIWTKFS